MRNILFTLALVCNVFALVAQTADAEYGKIVLTPHINGTDKLPAESVSALTRKLELIITKSGMVAREKGTSYVLSAEVSIGTKDIIAGPPQMIAQNLDLTLRVGDAASGIVFSMTTLALKGVGPNENKSLLEAFKNIAPGNAEIQACVSQGKAAIVEYYRTSCTKLIDVATAKAQQGNYDEAVYQLSLIPDASEDCYNRSLEASQMIYQAKINKEGAEQLQAAKAAWSAEPTPEGAQKAAIHLQQVSPYSTAFEESDKLSKSIRKKMEALQAAEWNQKLKEYEDQMNMQREAMRIAEENAKRDDTSRDEQQKRQHALDSLRIREYSAVAQAYARNQPRTIQNTYIVWR
jgi:hypothetical protein